MADRYDNNSLSNKSSRAADKALGSHDEPTTTGDAVYYDDRKNVAYVVGNAVSVDSKSKVTVCAPASGYLEQRTDLGRVRALNSAYKIPVEQFKLSGEK